MDRHGTDMFHAHPINVSRLKGNGNAGIAGCRSCLIRARILLLFFDSCSSLAVFRSFVFADVGMTSVGQSIFLNALEASGTFSFEGLGLRALYAHLCLPQQEPGNSCHAVVYEAEAHSVAYHTFPKLGQTHLQHSAATFRLLAQRGRRSAADETRRHQTSSCEHVARYTVAMKNSTPGSTASNAHVATR